jgi:hypothetical protein
MQMRDRVGVIILGSFRCVADGVAAAMMRVVDRHLEPADQPVFHLFVALAPQ